MKLAELSEEDRNTEMFKRVNKQKSIAKIDEYEEQESKEQMEKLMNMSQSEIDAFNAQQNSIKKEDILKEMFGVSDPSELNDLTEKYKNKAESEYLSDERSGGELDSDTEFNEIVELNNMLNEFRYNTHDELLIQEKILKIFRILGKVRHIIEFDSEDMKWLFNIIVANELQFISDFSATASLAKDSHLFQLPFKSFWYALQNLVLMKHHDMEMNHLIQLLYYLNKEGFKELTLTHQFLREEQKMRIQKISKYATFQLMIEYIKDQIENVINIETALLDDMEYLLMLFYLRKMSLPSLMSDEKYQQMVNDYKHRIFETAEGLNFMMNDFRFESLMDFLRIVSPDTLNKNDIEMLSLIISEKLKNKNSLRERVITYQEVHMILNLIQKAKEQDQDMSQCIQQLTEVSRIMLQKAIQSEEFMVIENDGSEVMERKGFNVNDIQFVNVLKKYEDLKIVDTKTSKLMVFEISQQILKDDPFENKEEANLRLQLLLYGLQNYKVEAQSEKQGTYLNKLAMKLHKQIYENDKFNEQLDVNEFVVLRDITYELKRILGENHLLDQQVEYLERKIYNYTKLYTI
eukprot:403361408